MDITNHVTFPDITAHNQSYLLPNCHKHGNICDPDFETGLISSWLIAGMRVGGPHFVGFMGDLGWEVRHFPWFGQVGGFLKCGTPNNSSKKWMVLVGEKAWFGVPRILSVGCSDHPAGCGAVLPALAGDKAKSPKTPGAFCEGIVHALCWVADIHNYSPNIFTIEATGYPIYTYTHIYIYIYIYMYVYIYMEINSNIFGWW